MSKNRSAAGITNIVQYDANKNITFVSGSTTLLTISSSRDIITTGTITAQTLVIQTVTSSVSFVTGSTKFGSISANTHQFTGSVSVSGSGTFASSVTATNGNFSVESSATNSVLDILTLTHTTSGTAASGLGAGILFRSERPSSGITLSRGAIYGVSGTDADDDGDLAFYTLRDTGAGGFNEKMRITSNGNVAIGTTNTSTEANLFLGAQGASEGGQLVLQRGTSYASASHLDNYQNRFRVLSGNDVGSTAERLSLNMANGDLMVYGSSYLGTNIITSNSSGATAGQYGNAVSAEYGSSSWTINLATILPNYTFSGRGLSVQLQILGLSDGSNGSSVLAHAYRSIGGTWVVNTVNTATNGTTFINSITASGTTITVNWNTTAFGCINVNVINRG